MNNHAVYHYGYMTLYLLFDIEQKQVLRHELSQKSLHAVGLRVVEPETM
jgi:hypothetical protein